MTLSGAYQCEVLNIDIHVLIPLLVDDPLWEFHLNL